VRDEVGTRYFINIFVYEYPGRLGVQSEVQFRQGDLPSMNVTLIQPSSIEEIERTYALLWCAAERPYYERDGE